MGFGFPAAKRQTSSTNGSPSGRRMWHTVHSWVGLKLSMFMSFVLITGTLAVFSPEIDWMLTPEMRASNDGNQPLPLAELYDRVKAQYPAWQQERIDAPQNSWFTAQVVAYRPDGDLRRIYIDPYTGTVLGDGPFFNVQRFLRETHRNLFLPTWVGVPLVGSLSFVLAISLVTGLVVYRKWWRGFFKWPRAKNRRQFLGNLHRFLGLWSLWFILLMSATSAWYFVEYTGGRAPRLPASGDAVASTTKPHLPGAELQLIAESAFEDLSILRIQPPGRPGRPIVFLGQASANLVRTRANFISLDPMTGVVIRISNAEDLSPHQRISEMADPLHFGTFGGFFSRAIWFIFGVILSTISVTGACIYGNRCISQLEAKSTMTRVWKGMGLGRLITIALISTYLIAGFLFLS